MLENNIDTDNVYNLLQTPVINALARLTSRYCLFDHKNNTCRVNYGKSNLIVTINNNCDLSLRTNKVLRYIICTLSEKGLSENNIVIKKEDLLNAIGLKYTMNALYNLKCDLYSLANVNITWESKSYNKKIRKEYCKCGKFKLISTFKFIRGYLKVIVHTELLDYLKNAYILKYPKKVLQLPIQHYSYAFPIADKVVETYNLERNKRKGREVTNNICAFSISVKKLYKICLLSGMTPYQEIRDKDRHVFERIIKPFEKALNECSTFFKWEYRNNKSKRRVNYYDWLHDFIEISNYNVGSEDQN